MSVTLPTRSAPEVDEDVREAFPLFPETFTVRDAYRALGYQPYRSALYLSLQKLVKEGLVHLVDPGSGRRAAVYQKTGAGDPPRTS